MRSTQKRIYGPNVCFLLPAAVVKVAGQYANCFSRAVSRSIRKNGFADATTESTMCSKRLLKRLGRVEQVYQSKSVSLVSSEGIADFCSDLSISCG